MPQNNSNNLDSDCGYSSNNFNYNCGFKILSKINDAIRMYAKIYDIQGHIYYIWLSYNRPDMEQLYYPKPLYNVARIKTAGLFQSSYFSKGLSKGLIYWRIIEIQDVLLQTPQEFKKVHLFELNDIWERMTKSNDISNNKS